MMVLYDLINTRAIRDFNNVLSMANYDQWRACWFAAAESIKEEMREQGLLDTVACLQKIIDEQRRFGSDVS